MQQDNHNFRKNERIIFFTDRLDTHHQAECAGEMSFLARTIPARKRPIETIIRTSKRCLCPTGSTASAQASGAWKSSIHQNKDVIFGTGDQVAIAPGGGQHAPLPEHHFLRMWYGACGVTRSTIDFTGPFVRI